MFINIREGEGSGMFLNSDYTPGYISKHTALHKSFAVT